MKKSIAVLMLGSALLLPNNKSVEASYSDNGGQVQKAQQVQYYVLEGKIPTLQFTKYIDRMDFDQTYKLVKSLEDKKQNKWVSYKDKKVTKHGPYKPVEKQSPVKPAEKPAVNEEQAAPEANSRHQK